LVSIKTGLSLGLLGAGALAFFALGGAKGIGQRIGSGFTGFGQSLADSFKFPEFVVEKSGGIQYDEKVIQYDEKDLQGKRYEIPNYYDDKTLIIPSGTVDDRGIFRSDKPPMTEEYEEWLAQQVPNVDLPNTTSTPMDPYPKVPSLNQLFPRLQADPASQTTTPPAVEPSIFDSNIFNPPVSYSPPQTITPNITSTTGGESYGWKNKFTELTGFEF